MTSGPLTTIGWYMEELSLSFESYGLSHRGCVRERNEDNFLVDPESGVWLVADGMGGHDSGDVASASIVGHLSAIGTTDSAPDLRARFEERLSLAHAEIRRTSEIRGVTIGSTVAALLAIDGSFACLWSGDSRIYLVRGGSITQLSRDHTEVQELVDQGLLSPEEARSWPRRNVITRAVGVADEVLMDFHQGEILPGDVFVLCTDGLTAHVTDREIETAAVSWPPQPACEALLSMALTRGGTDNVTVVFVRMESNPDNQALSPSGYDR
ncbi:MAG TPA: protein phosphatase 2C domain-containing protein [Rhizobiaceae bacterium]|nr:protein phosphatase 2C domain-containing protein [Rhizobiaceae bacterium]